MKISLFVVLEVTRSTLHSIFLCTTVEHNSLDIPSRGIPTEAEYDMEKSAANSFGSETRRRSNWHLLSVKSATLFQLEMFDIVASEMNFSERGVRSKNASRVISEGHYQDRQRSSPVLLNCGVTFATQERPYRVNS